VLKNKIWDFFYINGSARGFNKVIEYNNDVMCFSHLGGTQHHSIIKKLDVRYGGIKPCKGKAFKRDIYFGNLNVSIEAFFYNEKEKMGEKGVRVWMGHHLSWLKINLSR
jgi:hypothetical protein